MPIVLEGGPAFAQIGTEKSTGPKLFCVSGAVERPGHLRGAVRHHAARAVRARRRRPAATCAPCCSAARPACSSRRTSSTCALTFEDARGLRRHARLGRRARDRRPHGPRPAADGDRRVHAQRELRAVRAVPRRHRAPAGGAGAAAVRAHARQRAGRARADRRDRRRRCATRRSAAWGRPPRRRSSRLSPSWECSHDGAHGQPDDRRPAGGGARGLDDHAGVFASSASTRRRSATARRCSPPTPAACAWSSSRARACWPRRARGRSSPTWSSRPTPSASATARKMVMEFLASSTDLSTTPVADGYLERYDARPERYGPPAPPDPDRDNRRTGHHEEPDGQTAATVHSPIKVDNDLYVRDYSKCILCYKCVDACGDAVAEHVRHHRRGPRLRRPHLDRVRQPAARLGVRVLRQLHRGLPDRRADVRLRARAARGRARGTSRARRRPTRSARTAASAAPSRCTCRTTTSSRSPRPTITTSRAATSASRAASASSTCGRSRAS